MSQAWRNFLSAGDIRLPPILIHRTSSGEKQIRGMALRMTTASESGIKEQWLPAVDRRRLEAIAPCPGGHRASCPILKRIAHRLIYSLPQRTQAASNRRNEEVLDPCL